MRSEIFRLVVFCFNDLYFNLFSYNNHDNWFSNLHYIIKTISDEHNLFKIIKNTCSWLNYFKLHHNNKKNEYNIKT